MDGHGTQLIVAEGLHQPPSAERVLLVNDTSIHHSIFYLYNADRSFIHSDAGVVSPALSGAGAVAEPLVEVSVSCSTCSDASPALSAGSCRTTIHALSFVLNLVLSAP